MYHIFFNFSTAIKQKRSDTPIWNIAPLRISARRHDYAGPRVMVAVANPQARTCADMYDTTSCCRFEASRPCIRLSEPAGSR